MKSLSTCLKDLFLKLFSINDSPKKIAKGYAMGIFLATTPFVGLKVFIALFLTSVLRWNRKASIFGVYHVNALTAPFFYSVAYFIGKTVLGIHPDAVISHNMDFSNIVRLLAGGASVFWILLTGGLILGIPVAYIVYFITGNLLEKRHNHQTADQSV